MLLLSMQITDSAVVTFEQKPDATLSFSWKFHSWQKLHLVSMCGIDVGFLSISVLSHPFQKFVWVRNVLDRSNEHAVWVEVWKS